MGNFLNNEEKGRAAASAEGRSEPGFAGRSDIFVQPFDFSVDLLRCLLWQYNDAARLQSLLRGKQAWYGENQSAFWETWIRDVFDLRTANDFGLAVWGRILDQSREVFVPAAREDYPAWGFGPNRRNFFRSNFRRSRDDYLRLDTEQYRLLLFLRHYKLISRGSVPEINRFMAMLFESDDRVYVLDPLDMSYVTYIFTFMPSSWQRFVVEDMDSLPRPAGVGARIRVVHRPTFGFGPARLNFRGNFTETPRL
jgi:hypothetical protein